MIVFYFSILSLNKKLEEFNIGEILDNLKFIILLFERNKVSFFFYVVMEINIVLFCKI